MQEATKGEIAQPVDYANLSSTSWLEALAQASKFGPRSVNMTENRFLQKEPTKSNRVPNHAFLICEYSLRTRFTSSPLLFQQSFLRTN